MCRTKVSNTHSDYETLFISPRQQWLRERVSSLYLHMLPVVLHTRRETSEIVRLNNLHSSVPNNPSSDTDLGKHFQLLLTYTTLSLCAGYCYLGRYLKEMLNSL